MSGSFRSVCLSGSAEVGQLTGILPILFNLLGPRVGLEFEANEIRVDWEGSVRHDRATRKWFQVC
jgi:hypothetical protein